MTEKPKDKPRDVKKPGAGRGRAAKRQKEPIGDVSRTDLTSDETYELAAGIEEQRDA